MRCVYKCKLRFQDSILICICGQFHHTLIYIVNKRMEEHFQVNAYNTSFYLTIQTSFFPNTSVAWIYNLYLGGKKKGCLLMTVTAPPNKSIDERFHSTTSHIAKLTSVKYDSQCSVHGDLASGSGTQSMVRTLFAILQTDPRFQHVTIIHLDDASSIPCEQNLSLSLPHSSVALNGKTWYEKYFYATMLEPMMHTMYLQRKTILQTKPPFENIFGMFLVQYQNVNQIRDIYEAANNIIDCFNRLKEKYSNLEYCRLVGPWIRPFITELLQGIYLNGTWCIQLSSNKSDAHIVLTKLNATPAYIDVMRGGGLWNPNSPSNTIVPWEAL